MHTKYFSYYDHLEHNEKAGAWLCVLAATNLTSYGPDPTYPSIGRPSIDPVLMIRMLIVGYMFAIRSERLLCHEVNLAYRWFCGLSIEGKIPDHPAFSRALNERFRDSDIFRRVFEKVVEACIGARLVGGCHVARHTEGRVV